MAAKPQDRVRAGSLEATLKLDPTALDGCAHTNPSHFYADFLSKEGDYAQALRCLEKAARGAVARS